MNKTMYYMPSRGNSKGLTSLKQLYTCLENGFEVEIVGDRMSEYWLKRCIMERDWKKKRLEAYKIFGKEFRKKVKRKGEE